MLVVCRNERIPVDTNPYKAAQMPGPVLVDAFQPEATGDGMHPINKSRTSIVLVAFFFAAVAGTSFFGFAYNLTSNYPGTDTPVILYDPAWMIFHLIRGFGLGYLAFLLWTYQKAIKEWAAGSNDGGLSLAKIHNRTWIFGACFLVVNFGIAFAYVLLPLWFFRPNH